MTVLSGPDTRLQSGLAVSSCDSFLLLSILRIGSDLDDCGFKTQCEDVSHRLKDLRRSRIMFQLSVGYMVLEMQVWLKVRERTVNSYGNRVGGSSPKLLLSPRCNSVLKKLLFLGTWCCTRKEYPQLPYTDH